MSANRANRDQSEARPNAMPTKNKSKMSTRTETGYPSHVPTLFSRKSTDLPAPTEPEAVEETSIRAKNYTPSKRELGVTTPKRTATPRRAGSTVPVTKADAKVARQEAATERARKRAAMMEGEEWALTLRDKGPERRLVRDVVDARRNLAEYGLYAVFAFVIMTTISGKNTSAAIVLELLMFLLVFAVVIDSMFLSRRIKAVVGAKMPKANLKGLSRYGIARAMQFRRMRIPKPQVARGHKF